ncbi:AMP-dependent synthetase/ligase domain-containing protein [Pleurotus pulmonarius]
MPGSLPHDHAAGAHPLDALSPSDQLFFRTYSVGPTKQPPSPCIHHTFENHAASHPESLAIVASDVSGALESVTYAELDRRANVLAQHLRDVHEIVPGRRVCFVVERSVDMIVGILGILKSGAAYVLLDGNVVDYSALGHVFRDCDVTLSSRKFLSRTPATTPKAICLEDVINAKDNSKCTKPADYSKSEDTAYFLYDTKDGQVARDGVPVSHRNIANAVSLSPVSIELVPGRRVSQIMDISTSLAAWEIFSSLANGCTLCLGRDSNDWPTVKADIVIATPSMLAAYESADCPNVKVIAVISDRCSQALADKWAAKGVHLYIGCGLTDIAIINTMVSEYHIPGQALSIGKPLPNNSVYVLQSSADGLRPLALGDSGVIWLDPFLADGSYMVNTRKLGRWHPDGTLECLGPETITAAGETETNDGDLGTMGRELLAKDSTNTLFQAPDHQRFNLPLTVGCGTSEKTSAGLNSSASSSTIEKGHEVFWAGYEDDGIPDKSQGKFMRNLRHQVFSLYRRLFGIVFIVNMAILIATFVQGEPNAMRLGQIVIGNIFCSVLMRQEHVINAFFAVFTAVPPSWPMAIRRVCARVYGIGGIHSGAAVSGTVWLIAFAVQATRELVSGGPTSVATLVVTYCILLLLISIICCAYPAFRIAKHNNFERTHRFFGWTVTALVWAQVILLTNDYKSSGTSLGSALVSSPPFWLVVVLTCSIIYPWLHLRKVPVRAEILSSHAVRLYFDYVTPDPGTFTRVSDNPLFEWHGFATIAQPGQKGYSMVVSRAGDWTSKQIGDPPKELWVRGIPTCGVMSIVPIFRRVVLVATGSGIGPITPWILQSRHPVKLLWTAPDVRKTFGDKLVDSLLDACPDTVIYDTRKHGKPDMVKLTYRLVREFNAEAVIIISNQKLTVKVVYGMMSRGIPAFGAIWDS